MTESNLSFLQQILGYTFNTPQHLSEALRHSSYVNEQLDDTLRDNERLEFLGDAVLGLLVGHLLMKRFPHVKEGDLSRMRSSLVNEQRLSSIAIDIGIGPHILLGKGEQQTDGQRKKSILADTFEAIVAAIYLDAGFETTRDILTPIFRDHIDSLDIENVDGDYKSRLQEVAQENYKVIPQYALLESTGPDHDKTFLVEASVAHFSTRAEGKTKKAAEQKSARSLYLRLKTL